MLGVKRETSSPLNSIRVASAFCLAVLLFVSVLAQTLFAFVRGDFVTFAFSSARHSEKLRVF